MQCQLYCMLFCTGCNAVIMNNQCQMACLYMTLLVDKRCAGSADDKQCTKKAGCSM